MKKFEPQELDRNDHLGIEATADIARGTIKGFGGGALMALGIWLVKTCKPEDAFKAFFGGAVGALGLIAIAWSSKDWIDGADEIITLVKTKKEQH